MAPALLPATPAPGETRRHHAHSAEVVRPERPSRRDQLAAARLEAQRRPVLRERVAGVVALVAAFFSWLGKPKMAEDIRAEGELLKFALIGSLITTIVILLILARFIPKMFEANEQVVTTLNDPNVSTGDADADEIKPVFGFVLAIAFLLAIVSLIFGVYSFKNS